MRKQFIQTAVLSTAAMAIFAGLMGLQAPSAHAQGKGGKGKGQAPLQTPNPHYETLVMQVDVARPAKEVWARVGKYCDIGEWLQFPCTITSGKDGEVGVVRSIGNEVMVAMTPLSYTYTQPVREGVPYDLYHGTLEARPLTDKTSELIYTLVWDNSRLPDNAARMQDAERRKNTFMNALQNMKTLAEGGTLPPRAAGKGKGK